MLSKKKNKILFENSDDDESMTNKKRLFDENDTNTNDNEHEDEFMFDKKLELDEEKANKVIGYRQPYYKLIIFHQPIYI
jgi:hypothetical protein